MRACRRQQCGGAGSPVQHRVRGKHFGATYVSHHLISPLTGAPPASVPNMPACPHRPQLALNGSHVECGVSDLHHSLRNHRSRKPSYDTKRSERISRGGLCSRFAFGCFLCVVAFTSVEVSGGALEALSIAPPNASELPVREGVSAKQPVLQQVFPHSPLRDDADTGTGGKSANVLSSQLNVLPSLAQKLKEHVVTPVAKAGKAVAAAAAAAAAATASLPGRAVALGGPGFIEISAKVSALNDVFADADGAGLRTSREQRVLGRHNVGQASVDTARAGKILGMNEGSLRSSEPLDAAQEKTNGSAAGKSNLKAGEPVVLSYDPPPTAPIPPDPPPPLPTLLFQNGQAPQQPVQPQQQPGSEPLSQRQEPLLGQLPSAPQQMLLRSAEVLTGTPSMAQEQQRVQQQEQQQQEQQQQEQQQQSAVLHGVGGVTPVLLTNQQPVQQPMQLQMPMRAAPGSAGAPSSPLSVYGIPAGAASTASPVALTQQQLSGMPQFAPQPQQPVQQLQQLVQQPQQQLAEQQLSQQQVQQVALQHAQAPQPLMQQLTAVLQQPQQQLQQYAAQQQQLAAQQQAQQQAQALQQQQLAQQLQQQQQLPLVPVQVAMPAQPLQVLQGALQQQQQQQLQQLQQLQQQQQLLQRQAPPVTVFSSPLQQPQQQMQPPQQQVQQPQQQMQQPQQQMQQPQQQMQQPQQQMQPQQQQMQPQQQQMQPQLQQVQPQQQQGGALFATPLAPPGPAPSTPVTSCSLDTSSCQENAAAEEKAKKYAAQGVQCACQQLLLHLACSVMTKQSDLVDAEALKLDSPESSEATLQLRETACTALKTACPPISSLSLLATRVPSVPEQAAAAAAAATSASPVQLQLQEGAEAADGAAGVPGVGGGKTQQQQQRAAGGEAGGAPPRELLGGTVLLQNATSEAAAAVGRAAASGAGTGAAGDAGAREAGEPGAGTAVRQAPPGIPSLLQEAAAAESHAAEGSQGRAPAPRDGEVAAAARGAASKKAARLAAGERAAATGQRAATAGENEASAVNAAEAATEEGRKEEEVVNTVSFAQQGSRNGAANQQQQVSSALSEARIALLHKAEEQRQVQQDAVAAIRDLVQQEPSSFVHGGAAVHSSNAESLWVFATDAKEACRGVEGVLPIPLPVDAESDRHMLRLWIEGTEDSDKAIALHEEEKA